MWKSSFATGFFRSMVKEDIEARDCLVEMTSIAVSPVRGKEQRA